MAMPTSVETTLFDADRIWWTRSRSYLVEVLFNHEPAAPVDQDAVNVLVRAVDDTNHEARCNGAIQSGLRDLADREAVAEVSGHPVFVGHRAAIRADRARPGANSGGNLGINRGGKPGEIHASLDEARHRAVSGPPERNGVAACVLERVDPEWP